MPRTPLTPAQRADNITHAFNALTPLITSAIASASDPDVTPQERAKLWERVEVHGATIHRQARLLAGKSKGG